MPNRNRPERREWFLNLIKDMGYTQSAFAESSGISRQTLEKLISGNGHPSSKIAKKVEDLLGVPETWWENPPENPLNIVVPPEHHVNTVRHINCIGEVAIPAAFRRALNWNFGIDVLVTLDKTNNRLILAKVSDPKKESGE